MTYDFHFLKDQSLFFITKHYPRAFLRINCHDSLVSFFVLSDFMLAWEWRFYGLSFWFVI